MWEIWTWRTKFHWVWLGYFVPIRSIQGMEVCWCLYYCSKTNPQWDLGKSPSYENVDKGRNA